MIRRPLWSGSVATLLLLVIAGADGRVAVSNSDVLKAMPQERRLALRDKLEQFEKLSADEREAIRILDAELQKRPIEEQHRYLAVARRYHLALNSLTPEQRETVLSSPDATRIDQLLKLTTPAKAIRGGARQPVVELDSTDFVTSPPYEFAHQIRFWIGLTASEQAEINKLAVGQRFERVRNMIKRRNDPALPPSPAVVARVTDRQNRLAQIQKKFAALPKNQVRVQARFKDAMLLAEMDTPKVTPADLARFEAAIPSWLGESLDPLPPESLRRRLEILYRIAYPPGTEMPKAAPPAPTKGAPTKSSPNLESRANPVRSPLACEDARVERA